MSSIEIVSVFGVWIADKLIPPFVRVLFGVFFGSTWPGLVFWVSNSGYLFLIAVCSIST